MDVAKVLDTLDTLTLADLRRVQVRVNDLVTLIEGWQQPDDQTVETIVAPGGCLRLEWVKCGKERCKKCAAGQGHGPYWYRYESSGGRRHKTYLGKQRPAP